MMRTGGLCPVEGGGGGRGELKEGHSRDITSVFNAAKNRMTKRLGIGRTPMCFFHDPHRDMSKHPVAGRRQI